MRVTGLPVRQGAARIDRVDPALDVELLAFAGEVVRSALGSQARVTEVTPWSAGPGQAVCQLVVLGADEPLVLKMATAEATARAAVDFERTAAVSDLAGRAGVPVARVLAADTSQRQGPWSYLLAEQLTGVQWRVLRPQLTEAGVRSAHQQIAAAVVACQSIRFPSFGELDQHGRPAGQGLSPAVRMRARLRIPRGCRAEVAEELLDREASLFDDAALTSTLVHDDLHHANLVFTAEGDRPRLVGILDWDKSWAGPAESDVARMAFWDDMTGPGFWEVYGASDPSDQQVRRWLTYQLLWCLEYPVDSPRHRRDTADLCRRLGVRRPNT